MSRFNSQTINKTKTVNRAGGAAIKQSSELALASLLLTSFLKDKFYTTGKQDMVQIVQLVGEVDPVFAAQAAVYARNTFGMRSVSHVVAGEIGFNVHGESWTRRFFDKVVRRPDDMMEIASYYMAKSGKRNWPNAMKKGFGAALNGFNGYQLAKYRGEGKEISLVDVMNFSHPIAKNKIQAKLFDQLKNGTLKSTETYESKLSAAGQGDKTDEEKAESKAEAWRELLESRKIGYFALLRNLRNIKEQAPDLIDAACELLQDRKLIKNSLILPFQFATAYNEIDDNRKLASAVSKAIDISCDNVPKFDGKTLIAIDVSASMGSGMPGTPSEIAGLFGAVMFRAMDADVVQFGDSAQFRNANPDDSTVTLTQKFCQNPGVGHGTFMASVFKRITQDKKKYDRIFIFSDMQTWLENGWTGDVKSNYHAYAKALNPECKLYSFDLAGHGDMQFPEKSVYCLAGWSEKAFDVIKQLESGSSLVDEIKKVEI